MVDDHAGHRHPFQCKTAKQAASHTLAAIPIIAIFLAFQKYFTQGITMGAVKG